MSTLLAIPLALAGTLAGAGVPASSASLPVHPTSGVERPSPKPITVTGCLQKGDEKDDPHEFHLTTSDGKLYDVESRTLPLADHVGHTVTITGDLVDQDRDEEPGDEVGDIRAASLKHVSGSCQR